MPRSVYPYPDCEVGETHKKHSGGLRYLSHDFISYEEFTERETSLTINLVLFFLMTGNMLFSPLLRVIYSENTYITISFCSRLVVFIPYILYLVLLYKKKRSPYVKRFFTARGMGSIVMILFSLTYGLSMWASYFWSYKCHFRDVVCQNMASSNGALSMPATLMYVVTFNVLTITVKNVWLPALYISTGTEFFFLVLSAVNQHVNGSIYIVIGTICLAQILVFHDNESYFRRTFATMLELNNTLESKLAVETSQSMLEVRAQNARDVIGNVAHDMKSPLQAFVLILDTMMNSYGTVVPKLKESILELQSICGFMTMTTNRATDFAKITSGMKLVPSPEAVDIEHAVKHVVRWMGPSSDPVLIKVMPYPPAVDKYVMTDRQWLLDNLLCLVSNAQRFTSTGGITVRVSLNSDKKKSIGSASLRSALGINKPRRSLSSDTVVEVVEETSTSRHGSLTCRNEEFVVFEVEDTGVGVARADRSKVFLHQLNSPRRTGGSGLGLWALAARVDALGGQYGVADRSDGLQGCRFWFSLPYIPASSRDRISSSFGGTQTASANRVHLESLSLTANAVPLDEEDEKSAEDSPENSSAENSSVDGGNHLRNKPAISILLVEDSPLIRKAICKSFERQNIPIDAVNNGLECVEMVKKRPYDLILMDIQMPIMDGIQACEMIRRLEAEAHTPLLSARDDRGECESSEEKLVADEKSRHMRMRHFIIGVSANSDSESKENALRAGMDAFLSKPFTLESLKACCHRIGCEF